MGELWELVSNSQANMSLYYLMLHYWVGIGESEFAVRSLSVLFSVTSIPLVYGIGRRLLGIHAAWVGALLFAVNSFVVRYAQEARGYSLVLCLACLSTYLFIRALEDPRWKWWLLYALAAALSIYAHFFAGFVLLAHLLTLVIVLRDRTTWGRALASMSIVIAAAIPLILFLLFRSGGQINWIEEPSLGGLFEALADLAGGHILLAILFGGLSMFALVRGNPTPRQAKHEERYGRWLLATWLILPVGLTLAISFLKPILLSKYLIIILPALSLLAAKGLMDISQLPVRWGVASLVAVLVVVELVAWYSAGSKEEWRGATSYVLDNSRSGDGIILYSSRISAPFNYYVSRLTGDSDEPPRFIYPTAGWGEGETLAPGPPRLRSISESVTEYSRVWLVLSYASGNRRQTANALSKALNAEFAGEERRDFRHIRILLYE
jgi:mannosyltransferase